ncbi:MAG: hypothetical protein A2350_00265 [Candidatus Raymondbacteria bacterium RifOxyB12_full_50_8]|nr:MAG: hypothetical protein A2350_00265 [Candidatus Raymondbacteria bacterium RifOxyB12_full_50_8]
MSAIEMAIAVSFDEFVDKYVLKDTIHFLGNTFFSMITARMLVSQSSNKSLIRERVSGATPQASLR